MFQPKTFVFKQANFDPTTQCLNLNYQFDQYGFTEKFTFELAGFPSIFKQLEKPNFSLQQAIQYLHLAAGVSYYKLQPFATITTEAANLTQTEASFFRKLYINGLAEFAHRNALDITQSCHFPIQSLTEHSPVDNQINIQSNSAMNEQHALVLIGGGKDSLVSIEALKQAGKKITLFAVNPAEPILNCVKASGLPFVAVKRQLDPLLFELNNAGALNGHVPITAIISFTALIVAQLIGCDAIITSNEASANEATLVKNGIEINHQYSKSYEFEQDFTQFIQDKVNPNIQYFSLLRAFTEMRIVREFVKSEQYDSVFTSCNKAFRIYHKKSSTLWCLACPKCHFVHLMFAVSGISQSRLMSIFNGNPLSDINNIQAYRELVGLTENKPWECVGEKLESATAIYSLSQLVNWQNLPVVKQLSIEIIDAYGESILIEQNKQLLQVRQPHAIPAPYQGCFTDV